MFAVTKNTFVNCVYSIGLFYFCYMTLYKYVENECGLCYLLWLHYF